MKTTHYLRYCFIDIPLTLICFCGSAPTPDRLIIHVPCVATVITQSAEVHKPAAANLQIQQEKNSPLYKVLP